jgi:hypothetical protein
MMLRLSTYVSSNVLFWYREQRLTPWEAFGFCLSVKGVSVLSWETNMAPAIGVA